MKPVARPVLLRGLPAEAGSHRRHAPGSHGLREAGEGHRLLEPGSHGLLETLQDVDRRPGSPLHDDARLSKLAFKEDEIAIGVAADAVLGPAERSTPVKHVVLRRVEVKARRAILVAERARAMRVWSKLGSRPVANPF